MVRKPLAAIAATAIALVVLPAVPASASAASAARLTAGQSVFPGAGTFSVAVTNNEAPGFLGTGGTAINTVRINFPVSEAGIGLNGVGSAPSGWQATATDLGSTEFLTYRGGSIAPGATTIFNFPASVLRPAGSDRTGDFRVQVSSNGGESFSGAKAPEGQTLFSTVKVLEILPGTVKPTAPIAGDKGVGDRSGTAGQTVTYGLDVKNHATGAITVTPALTSTDASDQPGTASATSIPGNDAVRTLSVPVTLGTAPVNGQAARVFQTRATGTGTGSSVATPVDDTFTVQAPVTFSATELTPVRTKSGEGSAREFSLKLTKAGVQGATIDTSTFSFGGNSKSVGPLGYGSGSTTQVVKYDFLKVLGDAGEKPASVTNVGKDDNLAALSGTAISAGAITIDNIAPMLEISALLPRDAQGDQQVASSNNDVITVSGTVKGLDLDAPSLAVKLVTDKGRELPVSVSRSTTAEGLSFSGTVNVGTWPKDEGRFTPTATIADIATNTGSVTGLSTAIDTELPDLQNVGTVLTPTTIQVKFADPSGVRGGCDPNSWSIAGRPGAIASVKGNGGTACDPSALSDGVRILVLNDRNALRTTDLPSVTYSDSRLLGTLAAKDGAGNDALSETIETVSNLTPLAPTLVNVERRDGGTSTGAFEPAFRDAGTGIYYTNAADSGVDSQGRPVGLNRVTVSGVRNGYVLQVRATPNGPVLADTSTFNNTSPLAPSDYEGSTGLPVGTADGSVKRYLTFFVPATGRVSPATEVLLELDRKLPTIAQASRTSDTNVRTVFAEPIVAGSDNADDWFVTETVATESGTAGRTVNVDDVTSIDERTRDLTIDLLNPSNYQRVDYFFQSPRGRIYEDRAGNLLENTLKPV